MLSRAETLAQTLELMTARLPHTEAAAYVPIIPDHTANRATQAMIPPPADDSFHLTLTLPVRVRFATSDNLGFIYLITQQNAIEKYAPDGRLLTRYTNNRLGVAAALDVTNPLKVLVWYADFRTVVFLDRSLTLLGEFNLSAAGYPEVRAVAAAQDGNLWLYDEIRFQLRKMTPEGEPLFESQALNQLGFGRLQMSCLYDDGNEVLAADPAEGLLWFDIYGQYQKTLPWKGIETFIVDQHRVMYSKDGVLHLEYLLTPVSQTLPLPPTARAEGKPYWLAARRIFVQNEALLEVWSLF